MSEIQEPKWYVVHTYSGHENKVKATIEKAVKTRGMEDCILKVVVPTENVDVSTEEVVSAEEVEVSAEEIETTERQEKKKKEKKKKVRTRKIYPSYVFIKMIITNESWYIVRNTKGVTGFVGPDSKPVPLTEEDIASMGVDLDKLIEESLEIEVGDNIVIIDGTFKGKGGVVEEIDVKNESVIISLDESDNSMTLEMSIKGIEKI